MSHGVLIVGAGPTGLNLALATGAARPPFRIIDQAQGPGTQSRALAVHARTLEFYRQLGLAEAVVEAGTKIEAIRMREAGAEVAHVRSARSRRRHEPLSLRPRPAARRARGFARRTLGRRGRADRMGDAAGEPHPGRESASRRVWAAARRRALLMSPAATAPTATCARRSASRSPGGTYEGLYYVADVERAAAWRRNSCSLWTRATSPCACPRARAGTNG